MTDGKATKATLHRCVDDDGKVVHAFGTMEFELPKDHWIYGDESKENEMNYEPPPMIMKMGKDSPNRRWWEEKLAIAGRYAIRAATMNGKEDDFDPDALIQNLIVAFLGYHTEDGLSSDDWANPEKYRKDKQE